MKVQFKSFQLFNSNTLACSLGFALLMMLTTTATAQRLTGTENGEWRYLGGDAGNTRSSSLDQINASNFSDLEQAWIWRSDNFGPNLDYFSRSTPVYVDGMLYTVATPRRQVIAMDPATGENCLCRGEWPWRNLYHHAGFFPVGARCQDRPAIGELGRVCSARRIYQVRCHRSYSKTGGRLGAVARLCSRRWQL